jgi:hypothetical protein
MVETKLNPSHPSSMAERIHNRERNSGGEEASTIVKTGDGARRTFHNLHPSGSAKQHGPSNKGEGSIDGERGRMMGDKRQPAPDWAVDMAKIPFNPMEDRAAFAFSGGGPCSALPRQPTVVENIDPNPGTGWQKERPLSPPPGVALLDAQFDFLDAKEKAQRAAEQAANLAALKAQNEAFQKIMDQAAKFNAWFTENFGKKL